MKTRSARFPRDRKFPGRFSSTLVRKAVQLTILAFAILAGGITGVKGQSLLDSFDPGANDKVETIAFQQDGKILIGGSFTILSPNGGTPVVRNRIARLNADGSLDSSFNPNANGPVYVLAVEADGRILAGGDFTNIGGQTRRRLARLNPATGLADSFNPDASGDVLALALQPDGRILAGGQFASIGGQARNRIARLDPVTGMADAFDPDASGDVFSLAVQRDGRIFAAGAFTAMGGQPRNYIARLDAMTGAADAFNPGANEEVRVIALQADGAILAGGGFTIIGGQSRSRIARLNAVTGTADAFDPDVNDELRSLVIQPDGRILAGGDFTSLSPNGGGAITRRHLARLNADGTVDAAFVANTNDDIRAIAVQADGRTVIGGSFVTLTPAGGGAISRKRIARLEADGSLERPLDALIDNNQTGGFVAATALQPDGKILLGGHFVSVQGVTRNNIARLNADGTLDTVFNPNATGGPNRTVYALAVQADGRILAGGDFTGIGGQARNNLARLDPVTGAADAFNPRAANEVHTIGVQADGKILVGGRFSGSNSIGGQTRNYIARLDAATGLADTFNPNANGDVLSITLQPDGKILAGGSFTGANSIGGQARNCLARLDPATGVADAFNPNANDTVHSVLVQPDGSILAGGDFTTMGGQARRHLARIVSTTGLPDAFNPNANATVFTLALQTDGRILAGGSFTLIGGLPRNSIARLDGTTGLADSLNPDMDDDVYSLVTQGDGRILAGGLFRHTGDVERVFLARFRNDTAALQTLTVTSAAISWVRSGSSPHAMRVTFESSLDNVTFTPLGEGIADGVNWTLTGLSLPPDQRLTVRARAWYGAGYQNGSGSIQESLLQVFLSATSLQVHDITSSGNDIIVTFDAAAGKTYRLEQNDALIDGTWQTIPGVNDLTPSQNGPAQITAPGAISQSKNFYRVRLVQ